MPCPKKKCTRSRRDNRRAHDFLTTPGTSVCSSTGELKRPHRAHLSSDGAYYYKGKKISKGKED